MPDMTPDETVLALRISGSYVVLGHDECCNLPRADVRGLSQEWQEAGRDFYSHEC